MAGPHFTGIGGRRMTFRRRPFKLVYILLAKNSACNGPRLAPQKWESFTLSQSGREHNAQGELHQSFVLHDLPIPHASFASFLESPCHVFFHYVPLYPSLTCLAVCSFITLPCIPLRISLASFMQNQHYDYHKKSTSYRSGSQTC